MERKSITITTGTRPEIIKLALLIKNLKQNPNFTTRFVHSGQHYDQRMFRNFLDDLAIPHPDLDLKVGSGSHVYQLSKMMAFYEQDFTEHPPDLVIAQGDTNTVLASALTARKMDIPFGHVEAGIRSYDRAMPEEINRILAASCAELHFAPTELAVKNLLQAGVSIEKIFLTGNPIVDILTEHIEHARQHSKFILQLDRPPETRLIALTAHRPANVDERVPLEQIIEGLSQIPGKNVIIFPIHPRTRKNLESFSLLDKIQAIPGMQLVPPLNYFDFIALLDAADLVVTDSGGIQEEALVLAKPCIILRENTERPETLQFGRAKLVGMNSDLIAKHASEFLELGASDPTEVPSPFGTGNASQTIEYLITRFLAGELHTAGKAEIQKRWETAPQYRITRVSPEYAGKTLAEFLDRFPYQVLGLYDDQGQMLGLSKDAVVKGSYRVSFLEIK